jgi:hypothetical protein
VSIHADDEFSLRIALESELDDVVPRDGLAAVVIARHRRGRRRRVAGAVGLVVAFAGIGVPLGLAAASGGAPAHSGPVVLHLDSYTLRLPGGWHLSDARTGSCAAAIGDARPGPAAQPRSPGSGTDTAVAAVSSGGCVLMLLTAPFSTRATGDPNIPRGAREVPLGRYKAWLVPPGYSRPGDGAGLVIEGSAPGGRVQDLVIGSSGLSRTALESLVSANLSKAALSGSPNRRGYRGGKDELSSGYGNFRCGRSGLLV